MWRARAAARNEAIDLRRPGSASHNMRPPRYERPVIGLLAGRRGYVREGGLNL